MTISLPRWLHDMLAEHLTQPAPRRRPGAHGGPHGQRQGGLPHGVHAGVFGPAEAALPAEKQGLRFHDLRHTRATLLIAAGARAKRVQKRLGRSSISTTLNLYGHVLPCTEAALVDALDAIYEQCDDGDDAAAVQGS